MDNTEIEGVISAFLNKHANNRNRISTPDYEFEIKGINDVKIIEKSLVRLNERLCQFKAEATLSQQDPKSEVTLSNIKALLCGKAYFENDPYGDECLVKIQLDLIKYQIKQ